jgi:hypothetical protein
LQYFIRPFIDTFSQFGEPAKKQMRVYLGRVGVISKREAIKKKNDAMLGEIRGLEIDRWLSEKGKPAWFKAATRPESFRACPGTCGPTSAISCRESSQRPSNGAYGKTQTP